MGRAFDLDTRVHENQWVTDYQAAFALRSLQASKSGLVLRDSSGALPSESSLEPGNDSIHPRQRTPGIKVNVVGALTDGNGDLGICPSRVGLCRIVWFLELDRGAGVAAEAGRTPVVRGRGSASKGVVLCDPKRAQMLSEESS